MKNRFLFIFVAAIGLTTTAFAAPAPQNACGVVNFSTCVADSKLGKQEQASFESLKKQMATLMEDTERQMQEINAKFTDPEGLDGISQEAEAELKVKFQTLNEELNRYQNRYYQELNQANMRIFQVINTSINAAAEKVAKDKKLSMVINKEACFFYTPALDVTADIVAEMNKRFDEEAKNLPASSQAAQAPKS